jgi:hypothetical protein
VASWRPVGAILVKNGSITQEQLNAALAEQRRTGRKLGDILTSSGAITWLTLAEAIAEQAKEPGPPVSPERAAPSAQIEPADDRQRVLRELESLTDDLGALISRLEDHLAHRNGR